MQAWIQPLLLLAGAMILGWVAEGIVLRRLAVWSRATAWKGDDLVLGSVKGLVRVWILLLGVWLASQSAPLSPAVAGTVGQVLVALFILSGTIAAARASGSAIQLYAEGLGYVGRTTIATNLVRAGVVVLGALVLLQTAGISIAPLLTALGVGGLAVALALQDTLSNLFAGIQLLVQRQVRPGDFVRLDEGTEGYVQDVGWRNTTIRSLVNNLVVIPNNKLAGMIVTNCTLPSAEQALAIPVAVGYASDLAVVERLIVEVATQVVTRTPGGRADPVPVVRWRALGDHGVECNAVLRITDSEAQHLVRSEFIKAIHQRFRDEGIVVPYPTRTVHLVRP